MVTKSIGIREAKVHLSKFLKIVQNGKEIILTHRGRPVGKIVPFRNEDLSLSERIKRLEEEGLIEPMPKKKGTVPAPISLPDDLAQKILQEDRGDD